LRRAALRLLPMRVADALGVKYVLDGQVQRRDSNLRLSLHLVNGETGIEVWADRLTRRFENLFDLMDEVTAQLAATIVGRVETDAIESARRKPPGNMTAYDYMLRGLDYHRLGCITTENSRKAVYWFDKAIEADPNYGPAYAWRICAASWLPEFNLNAETHYIERALELDPNNPEAQRPRQSSSQNSLRAVPITRMPHSLHWVILETFRFSDKQFPFSSQLKGKNGKSQA
jgi:adenylate cyclase